MSEDWAVYQTKRPRHYAEEVLKQLRASLNALPLDAKTRHNVEYLVMKNCAKKFYDMHEKRGKQ